MSDHETWVDADHANTLNAFDVGDTRTTHAVVEQASTLQGGSKGSRGHRNDAEGAAGGHLVPETFSVYPEGGNGADIAAARVERSPSLTKVKSERGIHVTHALTKAAAKGATEDGTGRGTPIVPQRMTVRRLTPVECERLMGWPDEWTAPEGVKASDSKRYAACGDGIVAPVAFWIADRIRMIEEEEAS